MERIAALIARVQRAAEPAIVSKGARAGESSRSNVLLDDVVRDEVRGEVGALLAQFPVYPELDLDLLRDLVS